jgi:hypothetical protein
MIENRLLARKTFPAIAALMLGVAATPLAGQTTYFSGVINSNVTWSGRVFLTGDVSVGPQGHLTIAPGAVVESEPLADDQIAGIATSRIEIIVDGGTLAAEGTELQPIRFTSSGVPQQKGDWQGLRIVSGSARVRQCVVEYGTDGLRIEGGTAVVEQSAFRNNSGLGVDASRNVSFVGCTFSDNGRSGLNASVPNTIVTNCTALKNQEHGFLLGSDALVVSCRALSNGYAGIAGISGPLTIRDTIASGNDIGVGPYDSLSISNCTVTANGDGIAGAVYPGACVVSRCAITNNLRIGLGLYISEASPVTENIITGNAVGIQVGALATYTGISGNDIYGNSEYDLQNTREAAIIADGNYWGELTTSQLEARQSNLTKIFDSRDSADRGQVVIRNYRTKSILADTALISLSASPVTAGNVSGGGNYTNGANITVSASPNSGFNFVNWTEGGTIVSCPKVFALFPREHREKVRLWRHHYRNPE